MSRRIAVAVLLASLFSLAASASTSKHPGERPAAKAPHHDPAFRQGFDDGYREGAKDAAALSNVYQDRSSALYDQADDGYTQQYGDEARYQRLFREGYIRGYKAGWDFNAGQYCSLGCGGGGP